MNLRHCNHYINCSVPWLIWSINQTTVHCNRQDTIGPSSQLMGCQGNKWCHQMEAFSALLPTCAGNSPVTGEFPHKGQWCRALMFSLICAWIKGWVNNGKAGDMRCYHAHYDVTVMVYCESHWNTVHYHAMKRVNNRQLWTLNLEKY